MTALVNESAVPTLSTSRFSTLLVLPTPANPQHFRSHRQHAAYRTRIPATTTRAGGSARREPVMDRTTTMWTPDYPLVCCHRGRPSPDLPACASNAARHVLKTRFHFFHHTRPRVPLQTYLASMLYMSFIRRVGVFGSCVKRSSRFQFSLVGFGADTCIACWVLSIFWKVAQLARYGVCCRFRTLFRTGMSLL
ncbi:hypothetical protein BGY98DRAFT_697961 [Russula aff. rugulosa BPL654]|nr:hypothetical protein BGY98DRAFT_697961 [Russula aff. rugulosa BPL654]